MHGSHLGTLIPEPVRFPQLPGNVNALLFASMRQLKCDPYRDESFGGPLAVCGYCCSGFLSGLPSRGGDARLDLIFMLPQVESLDSEQEALVDWAVLQLQGSEGKCQRTRLGVKDFSTQVKTNLVDKSYSNSPN